MSFEVYGSETKAQNTNKPTVNYDELNRYTVQTCQLQQPETVSGVISVIVDLGTQKQPDAQYKLDDEDKGLTVEELEAKYASEMASNFEPTDQNYKITKFANAYDNDSKSWQIMKFVKQPSRQSIIYAVDFPDIIVDKGQFFGESKPLPLRLWAGGLNWNKYIGEKGAMLVNNVIPLKVTNIGENGNKVLSMNPRSSLYKMAEGAKLISTGDAFEPKDVDKLLGKTLQFNVRIFMEKGSDGKLRYKEKLKFAAGLARGMPEKQVDKTYLIQFNKENDPTALKELRYHVINTIKQATNYEGSVIQKQLEELNSNNGTNSSSGSGNAEAKQEVVNAPQKVAPKQSYTEKVDLDDSLPF